MSERLSLVIPKALKRRLEGLQEMTNLDQSSLLRQLLAEAVEEKSIEIAAKAFRDGKVSIGTATEIAGTSAWRFLDELRKRNVSLDYDLADARDEIDTIEKGYYKKFMK
jgi:predicted HTH domain antitoxin